MFTKLITLALRTTSKSIADWVEKEAGYHPKFRKFIISIAQANHRFTHATDVAIRPLNEERTVQAAADLLGQLVVFSVVGAGIIFEVQRSLRSGARRKELLNQETQEIKSLNEAVARKTEFMQKANEELARKIELLKPKLRELEELARGQRLIGNFNFEQLLKQKKNEELARKIELLKQELKELE